MSGAAVLRALATLAWRNLWRRPWRTGVMLGAVALGVWSMITLAALSRGSMEQQVTRAISNLTGHVQVHAPGYRDDPAADRSMPPPSSPLRQALAQPDVVAWSVRVRVPAVVASERESAGVTFVGIDPERERRLSFVARGVTAGRYLESPDDAGLLLGRRLAERLETGLGKRVVVTAQDAAGGLAERGYRVVGLFDAEPERIETAFVFTGLHVAQQQLALGDGVSELAVLSTDRRRLAPLLARLRAAAPGLDVEPWTALEPLLVVTERVRGVLLAIWYAVVFLAMSLGLVNTLLMAVFERTREIGLVQALGMQPVAVTGQILVESLFLLALGLALGNAAAWATLAWLGRGLDLSAFARGLELVGVSPVIYPMARPADVVRANALVLGLGLAASLYPAWRAARAVPVEAIARG
ncbi:MAG TPA: ABC transporter permease [Thermodesulfobacteriota bacterium]|nr:ABC transporter permease [Thermodesulfobacteriota bacterium]